MPLLPTWAIHVRPAATQHSPRFCQRANAADGERREALATVISCVAEPVSASWFASDAGHAPPAAGRPPLACAASASTIAARAARAPLVLAPISIRSTRDEEQR